MATNLIANPGFEVDHSGWASLGGVPTVARSTEQAHSGTASSKMTSTQAGEQGLVRFSAHTGAPVVRATYAFSMWVYATPEIVGRSARLTIAESGGASGDAGTNPPATTLVAGWQQLHAAHAVQKSDRTSLYVIARVNFAGAGEIAYMDDANLRPGRPGASRTLLGVG